MLNTLLGMVKLFIGWTPDADRELYAQLQEAYRDIPRSVQGKSTQAFRSTIATVIAAIGRLYQIWDQLKARLEQYAEEGYLFMVSTGDARLRKAGQEGWETADAQEFIPSSVQLMTGDGSATIRPPSTFLGYNLHGEEAVSVALTTYIVPNVAAQLDSGKVYTMSLSEHPYPPMIDKATNEPYSMGGLIYWNPGYQEIEDFQDHIVTEIERIFLITHPSIYLAFQGNGILGQKVRDYVQQSFRDFRKDITNWTELSYDDFRQILISFNSGLVYSLETYVTNLAEKIAQDLLQDFGFAREEPYKGVGLQHVIRRGYGDGLPLLGLGGGSAARVLGLPRLLPLQQGAATTGPYICSDAPNPRHVLLMEDFVGSPNQWWEQATFSTYQEFARLSKEKLGANIPLSYAISFAFSGIGEEIRRQLAANPNSSFFESLLQLDFQRIRDVAWQESVGGYQYGRGVTLYQMLTPSELNVLYPQFNGTPPNRIRLTEADVIAATLVTFHESSEGEFGNAFEQMAPWIFWNTRASNPDQNIYDILSTNWRETLRFHNVNGELSSLQNEHARMLSVEPVYADIYRNVLIAAQRYEAGLPDPTNRGISLQSHITTAISLPGRLGYEVRPEYYREAAYDHLFRTDYTDRGKPPGLCVYYSTPQEVITAADGTQIVDLRQGVANFLMHRGTFIRIEAPNVQGLVDWSFMVWDTATE